MMKLKLDRTLRVTTYFLLLLVAVVSCSPYPLGEQGEPPEPPEPAEKLIWYVASNGNDAEEGRDWAAPLQTVATAFIRILEVVENGWPDDTMAEIVIMDEVSEPVTIKKEEEKPDYPVIRLRGPSVSLDDGLDGTGTLRSDGEQYVLYIENNLNDVFLGAGLTLTGGKGGVYVAEAKFTIEVDATVIGNEAADGSGGGVYVGLSGVVTMKGGFIKGNTASSSGGGVYVASNGVFTMNGGNISENNAFFGGGVAVGAGGATKAEFIMDSGNALISNNVATFAGGGVYVGAGDYVLFDKKAGTISGNSAHGADPAYGWSVALGSTDINSPNQIANFKDGASGINNILFSQYIFSGDAVPTGWFYNGTENNWK